MTTFTVVPTDVLRNVRPRRSHAVVGSKIDTFSFDEPLLFEGLWANASEPVEWGLIDRIRSNGKSRLKNCVVSNIRLLVELKPLKKSIVGNLDF